jgi:hypothetical protein
MKSLTAGVFTLITLLFFGGTATLIAADDVEKTDDAKKIIVPGVAILRSATVTLSNKNCARADAASIALYYTEGFDFVHSRKKGTKVTTSTTSGLVLGLKKISSDVIKAGDVRILIYKMSLQINKKQRKEIKQRKGDRELCKFEITIDKKDISFCMMGNVITAAMQRHYGEAGKDVRVEGHAWFEGAIKFEPCSLPTGKPGLKVSFGMRLPALKTEPKTEPKAEPKTEPKTEQKKVSSLAYASPPLGGDGD